MDQNVSLVKLVAVISVLYIDDDQVFLDFGRQYMEQDTNIKVNTVLSAREALQLLKTDVFDAIISEYEMPDIDGIQLLKTVREKFSKIPFIIFSDKNREEIFIEAINNGADYYVKKGGDPKTQFAELSFKVRRAVEFQESERKIARLNRIDSVLRRINEAEVDIHDRMQLMQEVCKIMVKEGGFLLAWVGFENPETRRVRSIVASGAVDDFFVMIRTASDDIVNGQGPTVNAIRTGKHIICNNITAFPDIGMWEEYAIRKGYRSAAAFPLIIGKTARGAITLYSGVSNFFTDAEIRLLTGISEDISFVLTTLETEDTNRRVQEKLEYSEHRLSEIINSLPAATFAIDTNDTVILWNKTMEKLTKVSAGQVLGRRNYEYSFHLFGERIPGLLDLVFEPDAELEKYHYTAIERTDTTVRAKIHRPRLKGTPSILEIIASPLYDQQGQLSGAIESIYDITEINKKDEKFHRLFENSDYGILILESDTNKIIDVNPSVLTLTGFSLEYLIGKTIEETGFFKEKFLAEQFYAELKKTGNILFKDIPLETKSGMIIDVEFICRVISLNDHSVTECSIHDISDRKRTESAQVLSRKNLNTLSSMIRHDILNQLMVVSGSLELASYVLQEPDVLKHLNRAQTATKTIQRQIIFTREYENLGADVPDWQRISTVVHRAFLEVEADTVSLNIKEDNFDVFADPLFEKAFYLLFNYVHKYGEKVTRIDVFNVCTGTELIITIADNGTGISPENKPHLFEWRAGNEKTLSLFLVQKILSSTGITIRETGEFKKGTRFEIIVPKDGFRTGSIQP
ncbi:MAG: PAS domain S-box protein [Methanoregula sp.]|nr:PAS domain S-box protein [Methanoregula sp.]